MEKLLLKGPLAALMSLYLLEFKNYWSYWLFEFIKETKVTKQSNPWEPTESWIICEPMILSFLTKSKFVEQIKGF